MYSMGLVNAEIKFLNSSVPTEITSNALFGNPLKIRGNSNSLISNKNSKDAFKSAFKGVKIEMETKAYQRSKTLDSGETSAIFTGLENSSDLNFERSFSDNPLIQRSIDSEFGVEPSSSSNQSFKRTQIRRLNLSGSGKPQLRQAVPEVDWIWEKVRAEAKEDSEAEPALASYLYSTILAHKSLDRSLAFHLGNKLSSSTLLATHLVQLISDSFNEDPAIRVAMRADIRAVKERDPACRNYSHCILNFKGFLACQSHRVSHRLWRQGRYALALAIQSRVSEVFHVDIHPAAKIGQGVLFDHATGLVIGETAVVGNNVSILHHVTLGGTGVGVGRRHPTIEDGVLIGAGATILGPVVVGIGAKIGAGSVVLSDIPPHTTAVGSPAKLLGGKDHPRKMEETPSETMDHTSFISEWSDYAI